MGGGTDDDVLIQEREREREKRVFGYTKYPKVRIHIHSIPISRERNLVWSHRSGACRTLLFTLMGVWNE
jgi:hypothetical protein